MILLSKEPISLADVAKRIDGELVNCTSDLLLSAACDSSRDSVEQGLFVAIKGISFDSHTVVSEAATNGCIAAVVQDKEALNGLPGILVEDTRRAKAFVASLFTGAPEKKLKILGVTGTNGKSSTCWITSNLLNLAGNKCLSIGTLGAKGPGIDRKLSLTTPDAFELHSLFKEAVELGIKTVVMESSAHALTQYRIEAIPHAAALFLNLSHDHLDYYENEDMYFKAKAHLYSLLSDAGVAIVNIDDERGKSLWQNLESSENKISFGKAAGADFEIKSIEANATGTEISLSVKGEVFNFNIPFIAEHNVYNVVASLALLSSLGVNLKDIFQYIPQIPQIPGRLELAAKSPSVFVDYAHTPDALNHALSSLKKICKGKLWVVFGCGGDRDTAKRSVMGEVASKLADQVIVTSDNPRSEDPHAIIDEIITGTSGEFQVEADREIAINLAIQSAESDDVILIAGKGHEDYQIIGDKRISFSDVVQAQKAFKLRQL